MYVTVLVSCWKGTLTWLICKINLYGSAGSARRVLCKRASSPSWQTNAFAERFKCKWKQRVLTTLKQQQKRESCRPPWESWRFTDMITWCRVSRDPNLNSVRCVVPPENWHDWIGCDSSEEHPGQPVCQECSVFCIYLFIYGLDSVSSFRPTHVATAWSQS